jgi:acyl carrier protein
MSVEARIRDILTDILDVKDSELTPDAAFRTDLGASSIDVVEIVAALENEFRIKVTDQDVQQITTVGSLSALIQSKVT